MRAELTAREIRNGPFVLEVGCLVLKRKVILMAGDTVVRRTVTAEH